MSGTFHPLPAIAAANGPFHLIRPQDGQGGCCVSPNDPQVTDGCGQFGAPMTLSPEDAAIRAHEYGHLGLESKGIVKADCLVETINRIGDGIDNLRTPKNMQVNLAVQSILDVIVNAYMLQNGAAEVKSLPFPEYVNRKDIDVTTYLRRIGVQETRRPRILPLPTAKRLQALHGRLMAMLKSGHISNDELCEATQMLIEIGTEPDPEPKAKAPKPGSGDAKPQESPKGASTPPTSGSAPDMGETKPKRIPKPKNIPQSILTAMEGKAIAYKPTKTPADDSVTVADIRRDENRWMDMQVVKIPFDGRTRPTGRGGKRLRPGFTGSFRYPVRAVTPAFDGQCFGEPKRSHGGTMLIDLSGSMNLTEAHIDKLLAKQPHLTIAGYCGSARNIGALLLIAKGGKRLSSNTLADKRSEIGGCNGVDGPALKWLGKQRAPRVWVCDGVVTGCSDLPARNLTQEAIALKQAGRIAQYHSLGNYARGKARPPDTL